MCCHWSVWAYVTRNRILPRVPVIPLRQGDSNDETACRIHKRGRDRHTCIGGSGCGASCFCDDAGVGRDSTAALDQMLKAGHPIMALERPILSRFSIDGERFVRLLRNVSQTLFVLMPIPLTLRSATDDMIEATTVCMRPCRL